MVIEANFHPHSEYELDKLRGLGASLVEVHCACSADVAVARYNARSRHEVHVLKQVTPTAMQRYDQPVGIRSLITVDTTGPVDVAAVAAQVRRLHGRDRIRALSGNLPDGKHPAGTQSRLPRQARCTPICSKSGPPRHPHQDRQRPAGCALVWPKSGPL